MRSAGTIYLDYNATTPLDERVKAAMLPFLGEVFGNPSSVHRVGRAARAHLDEGRDRMAGVLRCKPSELVFTSGGTESINLALFGAARRLKPRGNHIVTSTIEHHAVLHALDYLERHEGFRVSRIACDSVGRIDPSDVIRAIGPGTILASIQAANNEIGTIQDVAVVGRACRERGVVFHTDAVQVFGKLEFGGIQAFEADLVSICAHKFHGPKGAGLLYIRSPFQLVPVQVGGAHENERRAGTENVACLMGMALAGELFLRPPVFQSATLETLRTRLLACVMALDGDGVQVHTPSAGSLPNTIAFTVADSDSMTLMANLDLAGICASSGSACSAGSLEPSHVIQALGNSRERAQALVRFSMGRENTAAEIHSVVQALPGVVARSQGRRPL